MEFNRKVRYKTQLGFFNIPESWNIDNKPVIMFHGVSVGEVIALEKLLSKAREVFPDAKILLTTGTVTGQEIAHKKLVDKVDFITYFPADLPFVVENFLKKLRPSMVFIAETEIWPYFSFVCKRRNIPVFTINGRISDSSFKYYKPFKFFFNWVLNNYSGIYTQSEDDNSKFLYLGSNPAKTEVMGNLKFDITPPNIDINIVKGDGPILLAGSTHPGEDEIVFDVYQALKLKHPNLKLLYASRHLTRLDNIKEMLSDRNLAFGLRSNNDGFDMFDVILLDTLGELAKMYYYCDIAFIGGSFCKTGGHNPLEAAIWNKPVISGPDVHNFKDIYKILTSFKAGFIVQNKDEFISCAYKLLSDSQYYEQTSSACKNVFEAQHGALDFVINKIEKMLSNYSQIYQK